MVKLRRCQTVSEKRRLEPDRQISNSLKNLEDLSDSELIRRWKLGDERAADCIVERYSLRMIALVASKMNSRFRGSVDPEDVAQSAFGSFFSAAKQSRIQFSQSVSLWRLLATIAKRKMLRSIERSRALKRGGNVQDVPFDEAIHYFAENSQPEASELLGELISELDSDLAPELRSVLEGILGGETQIEIAARTGVDERTVRRRQARLYEILRPDVGQIETETEFVSSSLPRVIYNQFVLGQLIGAGGFGKVYRATMQSKDAETVAVKFLRKAFWQDADAKRTFLCELEQSARIQHPSIVRYLGWGESPQGGPYVLMDWVDGRALVERPDVSAATFVRYLRSICEAIENVHREGVVHGDLTPSNILIDRSDRIVITDFGFSRFTGVDTAARAVSLASVTGGTPGFAAPEQISEAFGCVGPATDIYAIGGLAYWYLAIRSPHGKGDLAACIADTISADEPDVELLPATSATEKIIRDVAVTALRKSISDRPKTISQLKSILDNVGSK